MKSLVLLSCLLTAAPLPGASLYHLEGRFTDQNGRKATLAEWRSRPVLVSMFYSSCPFVCPTLIKDIRALEAELEPALRSEVRVVMITVDPEHDTPAVLSELAKRHHVDGARWSFLTGDEPAIREVAAALDIRYKRLPDGNYSHSTVVAVLDRDGVLVGRAEGKDFSSLAPILRNQAGKPKAKP